MQSSLFSNRPLLVLPLNFGRGLFRAVNHVLLYLCSVSTLPLQAKYTEDAKLFKEVADDLTDISGQLDENDPNYQALSLWFNEKVTTDEIDKITFLQNIAAESITLVVVSKGFAKKHALAMKIANVGTALVAKFKELREAAQAANA